MKSLKIAPFDVEVHPYAEKTTLVVAAKNEAQNLPIVLSNWTRFSKELIVVDGNSKDDTKEVAKRFSAKVINDNAKGKGDAIRCSLSHIQTEYTVFMDADGSHNPDDIPKLVEPLAEGRADHVTGSRLIGGSSELHGGFDEFLRLTGSAFITACINWRYKVRLSDSQNGFRAIRTEVLKDLGLTSNSTTIEQEMIMKTLARGFRMEEVPTHEKKRIHGESNIQVSKVWHLYLTSLITNLFFLPIEQR